MQLKSSRTITEAILTELHGDSPRERLLHRLHAVTLVLSGLSASEVGRIYDDSPRAVSYWVTRFKAAGVEGLNEETRPGRPSRLNQSQMKKLQTFLNGVALTSKKEKAEALSKYIAKEFRVALTVRQCLRIVDQLTK